MRVLMITSEWPISENFHSGIFIKRQVDSLRKAGVDIDLFHFRGKKNPLRYLWAWMRVRCRLFKYRYDLLHVHFGQSGLLAWPTKIPFVVTFHGSDVSGKPIDNNRTYYGKLLQYISRFVASKANEIMVVSEHMKQYLPNNGRAIHVIPSPIDLELFQGIPKTEARKQLGLSQDERLVLFVGESGRTNKRLFLAEQAVERVNRSVPCRLLVVWGVPPEKMPLYINACEAVILTSISEGSPNIVKEALACNVPVVSVKVGDVAERISGVEGCQLCADDQPETIAQALESVLLQDQRLNSRERVHEFDETVITKRVIEIYHEVLKN